MQWGISSLEEAWVALVSSNWKGGSTSRWRKLRELVLKRDGSCQACGQTEGQMHIDHVIPKRLGGGDEIWNLRQLCQNCNLIKGGRFFEEARTPPTLHGVFIPQNESISHD
jgi:5-methylcytosine-specific restriction endonuclease McrA